MSYPTHDDLAAMPASEVAEVWLIWQGDKLMHVALCEEDSDVAWDALYVKGTDAEVALLRGETMAVTR